MPARGIGCETCLSAHVEAGRATGLSDTDIALARDASAVDTREAALIGFAVRVLPAVSGTRSRRRGHAPT